MRDIIQNFHKPGVWPALFAGAAFGILVGLTLYNVCIYLERM